MTQLDQQRGEKLEQQPDSPAATDQTPRQLIGKLPSQDERLSAFAKALDVPYAQQVRDRYASALFLEQVPISYARQHGVLGFAADDPNYPLPVAFGDLAAWDCLDALSRKLGRTIEPILAPRKEILAAINQAYQQRTGQAQAMIEQMSPAPGSPGSAPGSSGSDSGALSAEELIDEAQAAVNSSREDLLDVGSRAPVIKLVNLILFDAVKQLASDVHVQPYEEKLVVRMRIDGVLFNAYELPAALHEEMVSRIKVMGRMNIAEKRLAQDGRATVQVGDRIIDLRLSSVPTSHGERVVIRLLDKSARLYTLNELGMPKATLEQFRQMIRVEHGLILVTGPTGSGKTTTLYGALQELNYTEANILTLEDPIEYQLDGISQIQVATKKGMTFASGLRSVLRQDPDIIMVGEIRDRETAVLAIQSALTGHLVFSTLHTNDAASAVTRLLDLGIEPYLVASSVIGVMAQRLVRRVCSNCGTPLPAHEQEKQLQRLGVETSNAKDRHIQHGTGCESCRQTGYRGRVGLFELLMVDVPVQDQIQARGTASDVKRAGRQQGMKTLRQDGVRKILSGLTTLDEILRVTPAPGSAPSPESPVGTVIASGGDSGQSSGGDSGRASGGDSGGTSGGGVAGTWTSANSKSSENGDASPKGNGQATSHESAASSIDHD